MSDQVDPEFEDLVSQCMAYYEAGVAPSLSELRALTEFELDAMREASRRVRGQEINALVKALSSPAFAAALSGDSEEVASVVMAEGLKASRDVLQKAREVKHAGRS